MVEAPFEMANLYPRRTGLSVTVWVSPRGNARHAARIKVCRKPGESMDPSDLASVRIEPDPPVLIDGPLAPEILAEVAGWITLNRAALLDYWKGAIDTMDLNDCLQKV